LRDKNLNQLNLLHGVAIEKDFAYVVFDIIKDFMHLNKKCELVDYKTKIKYLIQAATIVNDLHSFNIIHRNLKPMLILVKSDENVSIVSFGLSLECKGIVEYDNDAKGTTKYMPPEAFEFKDDEYMDNPFSVRFSCDIWSLGVVMSECLGNQDPWTNLDYDTFDYKAKGIKRTHDIKDFNILSFLDGKVEFPIAKTIPQPMQDIIKQCVIIEEPKRIKIGDLLTKLKEYYNTL